jgi:hypothetical protein
MSRQSFVQINGRLYDKSLPLPEDVKASTSGTPMVRGDLPDFVSPIDGKLYSGRAGLRDHCARHNVVPTADLTGLPPKPVQQQYQPDRAAIRESIRKQLYR